MCREAGKSVRNIGQKFLFAGQRHTSQARPDMQFDNLFSGQPGFVQGVVNSLVDLCHNPFTAQQGIGRTGPAFGEYIAVCVTQPCLASRAAAVDA
jgi:hypothetical protein